jgi:hypothetical protein
MERRRDEYGERVQYVVLSRAHAGLYNDIVSLFSAWPEIHVRVIVDRRHGRRESASSPLALQSGAPDWDEQPGT